VIPADDGSYDAGTHTITWSIGTVAAGTGGSVSFTADIVSPLDDGTVIYNTATIDSDQTDPVDTNTSETEVESAPEPPPTPPAAALGGTGCPMPRHLTVDWDENISTRRLYSNDRLTADLLGPSPDGKHSLLLERFTLAPIVDRETHYVITVRELEETPSLPQNTAAIAAFEIAPAGALFDRDIFLTFGFDQLPDNAVEGTLRMAYYDDDAGLWEPIESEPGQPNGVAELTLTAPLTHFSIYGVLVDVAPPTPLLPATFVASDLTIEPSVERIWEPVTFVTRTGETTTVTARIANEGGAAGTYTVALKLNGQTMDTRTLTLSAGQSQQVTFTVSGLDPGQYEVEVAQLSDSFTASRTINWPTLIIVIVVIGLISGAVVWAVRRRKARQEQKAIAGAQARLSPSNPHPIYYMFM
ncbi:MAG: hypothetical protein IBX67_00315, partial [Dehalococcoidia bacterium]|nr:hypothetical protein [Dehalococcoidia bacterium]